MKAKNSEQLNSRRGFVIRAAGYFAATVLASLPPSASAWHFDVPHVDDYSAHTDTGGSHLDYMDHTDDSMFVPGGSVFMQDVDENGNPAYLPDGTPIMVPHPDYLNDTTIHTDTYTHVNEPPEIPHYDIPGGEHIDFPGISEEIPD